MTEKLTRRAAIGAIATLPAVGVAAAAVPPSSVADLIEAHKAARAALNAALDRMEEVEKACFAEYPKEQIIPLRMGGGQALRLETDMERAVEDCRHDIAMRYEAERKRLSSLYRVAPALAVESDRQLRKAEAADKRQLRKAVRDEEKRQEEFGLTAVLRDVDAASESETDATVALLSHPCRRPEEGRARAEYILGGVLLEILSDERFMEALLLSTT